MTLYKTHTLKDSNIFQGIYFILSYGWARRWADPLLEDGFVFSGSATLRKQATEVLAESQPSDNSFQTFESKACQSCESFHIMDVESYGTLTLTFYYVVHMVNIYFVKFKAFFAKSLLRLFWQKHWVRQ